MTRVSVSDEPAKRKISASERWLLISRKVYGRAQRRGFVGGDPLEDLSDAIREIDDEYVTDVNGLLSLTDPAELVEQFQNLFAAYGLGKRGLDRLLDLNRDALEKLAVSNRQLVGGVAERTARQTALLRNAAEDAIHTLQSIANGAGRREGHRHLPGTPTQAMAYLLTRLRGLAESAGYYAEGNGKAGKKRKPVTKRGIEIHGTVVKAYDGMTPAELAEAPVSALKGLSRVNGEKLKSAFGMASIRDMASKRLLEQAEGIVTLADEEVGVSEGSTSFSGNEPLRELADGPVSNLQGVNSRQARVLEEALRIRTVRDLADNRFFRVARAMVALADVESRP